MSLSSVRYALKAALLLIPFALISVSPVGASNDFGTGEWDINLGSTQYAGYYNVYIAQMNWYDGTPGTFTSGWLSVDLANQPGTMFPAEFTQVGVQSELDIYGNPALHWFVYTEAFNMVCITGVSVYYRDPDGIYRLHGCAGQSNELVHLNEWEDYALVRDSNDSNRWYADVVGHINGQWQGGHVAYIPYSSNTIYDMTTTAEEEFDATYYNDPLVFMGYQFYHPVYSTGFTDWPSSTTNTEYSNGLRDPGAAPYPYPSCYYGGIPNYNGDSRFWYYGYYGSLCGWTFSP